MATITRENIGLLNEKIVVKVAKDDYISSFEKTLKNYSKTANIPGFRKGMVPSGMIKKMHGQAVFTDEVLRTVEKELSNYMANEKLEIFAQPLPLPENDARSIDMNNPAEYAFAFEVGLKPHFDLPDFNKEIAKRYKVIADDEMVEKEVERLQMRHGKMTEPETVTGDDNVLNVSFIEMDDQGNEKEGGIRKDNSLLVKYFTESFRQQLIGKKKDDVLTATLSDMLTGKEKEWVLQDLGIELHDASADNKNFRMLITKVGLVEKAALDDAFFKTSYPQSNIADETSFRSAVKEDIEKYWEGQSRNHLQHEIYHLLVEHTHIDFPESFLKKWMQNGTEAPKSQQEVEAEYPVFVNQLKWTLITDKIMRDQSIEVGAEDIKSFARKQLTGYMGMNTVDTEQPWMNDYVTKMMQDKKFVEDAFHRIQTEKVFEWAEKNVPTEEKVISADEFASILKEHEHHHH
ncbi:MAG TPA: trigger factor [Flavitalea sp.]|nr:trigger factor [Flavitalea sp.]